MGNVFHCQLWIWFSYISCHYTFGLPLDLARSQSGDYFNNPYSTSCNDDDRFCVATKSICYPNRPKQGDKCCYCRCQVTYSTFNLTTLRCALNSEYRPDECFYRFGGDRRYDELYLNEIDMTVSGDEKLINSNLDDKSQKHLKNCAVNKVEQMNSTGYETVASHPFSVDNKKHHFELEWSGTYGDRVYGRVYRIILTCKYKSTSITGCLMLKSAGTVQVNYPGLPEIPSSVLPTSKTKASLVSSTSSSVSSSPLLITEIPSTIQRTTTSAKEFIQPSYAFVVNSPSLTQWIIPLQFSVEKECSKSISSTIDNRENSKETMAFSSSSIVTEFSTSPDKERQSSEKDGSIVLYIVVVVVVFVVIIALAVVVLFIMRRKKKKTLKKHKSQANIMLSDMNKNNVNKDEDGFYTSLDKSEGNDESNYEALRFPETNKNQSRANNCNEKMLQNENEYAYADAGRLYSTTVDDKKLGAKNNDAFHANENERVYSILETEPGQISYPTPSRVSFEPAGHGYTGDSDVDYVTVLPSKSEPGQSDCPVYADLSGQRDAENEYQSLVKRKK